MNSVVKPPYSEQGRAELDLVINNMLWGAFYGTTTDGGIPAITGGSTGLPRRFVSAPGSFNGSAAITTTVNFNMIFGVPLHVGVALFTSATPCCFGTSVTSNFFNSATLTELMCTALVKHW